MKRTTYPSPVSRLLARATVAVTVAIAIAVAAVVVVPRQVLAAAPVPGGGIALEGTVVARRSAWEGGVIVTRATVRVDRIMRGAAPPVIEVTQLGGQVGDIAQVVLGRPALPAGPRVALELMPVGKTWWLSAVLEAVASSAPAASDADLLAAGSYVRATNKDSSPPCPGDLKQVYWPTTDVPYFLDDACSVDVDRDACEAAVQASFQTWQDVPCAYINFPYGGRIVDAPVGYLRDGGNLNVVKWMEADWPGDPAEQAITLASIGCTTGQVLDADILVNGGELPFTTVPIPGGRSVDVQNTITHEAGHVAGFAHAPDIESTMYATAFLDETKKRDLTADDAQGLCDVYPIGHEPGQDTGSSNDSGGCGCATAGRTDKPAPSVSLATAVLVTALAVLATRSARRRRPQRKS